MSLDRALVRPLVSPLVGPLVGFGGASGPPVEIAAGNLRAWYNLQQSDLVFQDSALTTPAGDNDPIGALVDWYGLIEPLIQTTAANKPTKRDNGAGIKYADFDGVGDLLRGATAATWKELHGPNGGGIYVVGAWTGTGSLTSFAGNTALPAGSATNIGLRLRLRALGGTSDRPTNFFGDGTNFITIDGAVNSWLSDTVKMAYAENDYDADTGNVRAEPASESSTSTSAMTHSTADGGSLFVNSATTVIHLYEIVVRSPILTSTEYDALKAYWNTTYSLGL